MANGFTLLFVSCTITFSISMEVALKTNSIGIRRQGKATGKYEDLKMNEKELNGRTCKGQFCTGQFGLSQSIMMTPCKAGQGSYKDKCKDCDCGGKVHNCTFDPTWISDGKTCLCASGYGKYSGKCLACNCGGEQHNCTMNVFTTTCICAKGYKVKSAKCQDQFMTTIAVSATITTTTVSSSTETSRGSTLISMKPYSVIGTATPDGNGTKVNTSSTGEYTSVTVESNKCQPNPCQNGGTCLENVNTYTCKCDAKHTGRLCEKNNNGIIFKLKQIFERESEVTLGERNTLRMRNPIWKNSTLLYAVITKVSDMHKLLNCT